MKTNQPRHTNVRAIVAKFFRYFAVYALFLCLLLPVAAIGAGTEPVKDIVRLEMISAEDIALPVFEGFDEVYGRSPEFDALLKQFVPPGNRLLGVYIHKDDMKNIAANPDAGFTKYILVQTLEQSVVFWNKEDFQRVKESFIKEMSAIQPAEMPEVGDMMTNISSYLSTNYKTDLKVKVGEVRNLGEMESAEDRIGFLILSNYGVTTPEGKSDYPVAAAMMAMNVRDRLIFVYTYLGKSQSAEDIAWVKETATQFSDRMQGVNAERPAVGADAGSFLRNLVLILLGALGGIVGVMLVLNRKRHKDEVL